MPKVPTAREAGLGRQAVEPVGIPVQSFGLPAIRVPRDRSGESLAGLGRAVAGVGDSLGSLATEAAAREQAARRQALVKEAETASAAAVGDLLRHPESGYLATSGRAALLSRGETLQALDRIGRRSLEGLEPAARPAFQPLWTAQRARAAAAIDDHSRAQFGAWLDTVDLGRIQAARDEAAASGGEPETVGRAQAESVEALASLAARRGWPAERRRALEGALRSRLHDSVLRRLLAREDFGRAQAYYRATAEELTAADRRSLMPLLDQARERAALLARNATAERLLAEWRAEGLGTGQQRDKARLLRNPALGALVAQRIERTEAETARRRLAENRQAMAQAIPVVEQGGLPEDLPFETWRRLGPEQRAALADRSRRLALGEATPNELLTLHRLRRLAAEEPGRFAELDLFTEARNRLADPAFAELERRQAALVAEREGRARAADLALLDREAAIEAATARVLEARGHELGYASTPDEARVFAAFGLALRRRLAAEERRRGAAVEPAGLDALAEETYERLRHSFPTVGEA